MDFDEIDLDALDALDAVEADYLSSAAAAASAPPHAAGAAPAAAPPADAHAVLREQSANAAVSRGAGAAKGASSGQGVLVQRRLPGAPAAAQGARVSSASSSAASSTSSRRTAQTTLGGSVRGATTLLQVRGQNTAHRLLDRELASTWIWPTNQEQRDYQFNIISRALFQNTLVCLPTGLGKTFIAAVVMYNLYRWMPRGHVVFMAPTRPLVTQQILACYRVMGIPQEDTVEITGSMKKEKRVEAWNSKRMIFATPQIMWNDMKRCIVPLADITCIVIDEAHKAQGEFQYVSIVRQLSERSSQFRVLALTATPGSDLSAIQAVVNNLRISALEVRDEMSLDVRPYVHERAIQLEVLQPTTAMIELQQQLNSIVHKRLTQLVRVGVNVTTNAETVARFALISAQKRLSQNPPPGLSQASIMIAMGDLGVTITMLHARNLIATQSTQSALSFLENKIATKKNLSFRKLAKSEDFTRLMTLLRSPTTVEATNNPKIVRTVAILLDYLKNAGDSRVIVFAEFRDTVTALVKQLDEHRPIVRATPFIGHAKNGLSEKRQQEVLEAFRDNTFNVICSTSIGEEGLDIGQVDLVILFDAVDTPGRLTQRMGRTGRKRDGRVIVLVSPGAEEQKWHKAQDRRKTLRSVLLTHGNMRMYGASDNRLIPDDITPRRVDRQMFIPTPEKEKWAGGLNVKRTKGKGRSKGKGKGKGRGKGKGKGAVFDPDSIEPLDIPDDVPRLTLSAYAQLQGMPNETHLIAHSRRTDMLVKHMLFIMASQSKPDDFYEVEMQTAADLFAGEEEDETPATTRKSASRTRTPAASSSKRKRTPAPAAAAVVEVDDADEEPPVRVKQERPVADADDDFADDSLFDLEAFGDDELDFDDGGKDPLTTPRVAADADIIPETRGVRKFVPEPRADVVVAETPAVAQGAAPGFVLDDDEDEDEDEEDGDPLIIPPPRPAAAVDEDEDDDGPMIPPPRPAAAVDEEDDGLMIPPPRPEDDDAPMIPPPRPAAAALVVPESDEERVAQRPPPKRNVVLDDESESDHAGDSPRRCSAPTVSLSQTPQLQRLRPAVGKTPPSSSSSVSFAPGVATQRRRRRAFIDDEADLSGSASADEDEDALAGRPSQDSFLNDATESEYNESVTPGSTRTTTTAPTTPRRLSWSNGSPIGFGRHALNINYKHLDAEDDSIIGSTDEEDDFPVRSHSASAAAAETPVARGTKRARDVVAVEETPAAPSAKRAQDVVEETPVAPPPEVRRPAASAVAATPTRATLARVAVPGTPAPALAADKDKMQIFVASREVQANVCVYLQRKSGIVTVVQDIPRAMGGAYILSKRVAAERRTYAQLVEESRLNGSAPGGLQQHVSSMLGAFSTCYLIIEPEKGDHMMTGMELAHQANNKRNFVRDFVLQLTSVDRLHVLHTRSVSETADMLASIAEAERTAGHGLDIERDVALQPHLCEVVGALAAIPGMSWPRAYSLVKDHDTFADAIAADPTAAAIFREDHFNRGDVAEMDDFEG